MRKRLQRAAFLLAACLACYAQAFTASSGEIKTGEWNTRIIDLIDKAEKENIPLVMVGSAAGCVRCMAFESGILPNAKFQAWVKNSPYLFCWAYAGGGWFTTKELRAFTAITGDGGTPVVSGYWKKKDGTVVGGKSVTFVGYGLPVEYYMNFWDKLFAGYDPNVTDQWDPADDTKAGATTLTPAATENTTSIHYLSAEASTPDKEDWFKMPVEAGKRYRLSLNLSTYENVAAKIDVELPGGEKKTFDLAQDLDADAPFIFEAAASGDVYVRFYYSGTKGKSSYKLAYREFEAVDFSFAAAAVTVKENDGKAELTVNRKGRLTDAVTVHVATADGTAVAGTNYTALDADVTIPADKESQTVSINIADIPGSQGATQFTVALTNPEDTNTTFTCTVSIEDLDIPTDAHDPADDTAAGAVAFDITDETQSVAGLEQAKRVVSGQDATDWYAFNTAKKGSVYQVKVPAGSYSKRPASDAGDPEVVFSYGADGAAFETTTLSKLETEPFRFTATEDAPIYVKVSNGQTGQTVYTYDLAWQEWVLPIVSFTKGGANEMTSAAAAAKTERVELTRTKNLEEAITVRVAVSGVEGRVNAVTNDVTFAAGAATAQFNVSLMADGGMWRPDQMLMLTILDEEQDQLVHNAEGAVHAQVVVLKTEMAEFDADDGVANANASVANPTELTVGKKPATRADLTLNGSDKADWYKFSCEAGTEYVFELVDLKPETAEASEDAVPQLPLEVQVYLPGQSTPVVIGLQDCVGAPYHFTNTTANAANVLIGVMKTADEPPSISYGLKYREWVPATIGLVTDAIEVSELASSVRVGVKCDMDVPLPSSVRVITEDGTATAGEDYVALDATLSWDESSPNSSVKYAVVNLKKLVAEYEGEKDDFKVKLDFSASDAIEGDIVEATVTIVEADAGAVGLFAIGGFAASEEKEVVFPYQAKAIAVTAGQVLPVKLVRTAGNAGKVTATLTWKDGSAEPVQAVFEDLETEKWVLLTMPQTEGAYVARQAKSVTLTTDNKAAKTKNATLNLQIEDSDKTLAGYAADRTNLPFSSSGNAWFESAEGVLRTKALAAKQAAQMTATVKGAGVLSFTVAQTGAGELTVKAGSKVLEQSIDGNKVTVSIPSGTQRVAIIFAATAADAWMSVDDIVFTPDASFFRTGSFYGQAVLNGETGALSATVSAAGRLSGRVALPGNVVWTLTAAKLVDGASSEVVLRRGRDSAKGEVEIDETGLMAIAVSGDGAELDATAARNGWSDRPLTGAFADNADLLGLTLVWNDAEMGDELTFRIAATGSTRVTGRVAGATVSSSVMPFRTEEGAVKLVLVAGKVEKAAVFAFKKDEGSGEWSVSRED